ncbi:MAG: Rieske 2Fe-2S domain-containing protein [Haloferacaceae archaeon]|jgi:nitrite reductase/ring-hydroxylating ferredoxin subunit
MSEDAIAPVADVPTDGTLLFTMRARDGNGGGDDVVEVVLSRRDDEVVAYRNYCKHWTDVRLDTGSGAAVRDDELVCERHGATFERESGVCTFGPCEGAVLDGVAVDVVDGTVHLAEEAFEFVSLDGEEGRDLSSGSRIGFDGA